MTYNKSMVNNIKLDPLEMLFSKFQTGLKKIKANMIRNKF